MNEHLVKPTAVPVDPGREQVASGSVWVDDPAAFGTDHIHKLRHGFSQHPLLALERLGELAESLCDAGHCRFMPTGLSQSSPFTASRRSLDGRSVAEIFRDIEEPGSWIAMYNVETDPDYRRFLWDVMSGLKHLLASDETVFDVRGFIFVSAPPSLTPFHIDRENNFWLQIRGRKVMRLWDRTDREVVSARDVEAFMVYRTLENVVLKDSLLGRCLELDCGPGDGVFFPSTTPHMTHSQPQWVRPGNGVSVSIGINFYTERTRRAAHLHNLNRVLRKMHMEPRYPGQNPWLDRFKYPFARGLLGYQRRFRGFVAPPGF